MKKTIKKILKEETERKLPAKFLIKAFKILDKWMLGEGHDIDEVSEDASVYESIIDVVETLLSIKNQEDIDFIVASFVLNYMTAGDWDLLKEIGIKEPQKKKWDLTKTYSVRGWITDVANDQEGYLESQMQYDDWHHGYDWEQGEFEINDTFDTETDITERR